MILEQTAPLWEEVRGQSIFVTGGRDSLAAGSLRAFAISIKFWASAPAGCLTRNPKLSPKSVRIWIGQRRDLHAGDVRSFSFPRGVQVIIQRRLRLARSRLMMRLWKCYLLSSQAQEHA